MVDRIKIFLWFLLVWDLHLEWKEIRLRLTDRMSAKRFHLRAAFGSLINVDCPRMLIINLAFRSFSLFEIENES